MFNPIDFLKPSLISVNRVELEVFEANTCFVPENHRLKPGEHFSTIM
jgi:hypothetical protein